MQTLNEQNLRTIRPLDWPITSLADLPLPTATEICLVSVDLCFNGSSTLRDSQRAEAIDLLSDAQWDRFARRPDGTAKESYLTGRYFLLHLLAHLSEQTAQSIKLSYNKLNKPFLEPNPRQLEFNFTDTAMNHHGNTSTVGVFAFCYGASLGVDIEAPNRQSDVEAIARRRFTPNEYAFFIEGSKDDNINSDGDRAESERAYRFLQIWTRKEAFGKACGLGINYKMNERDLLTHGSSQHYFEDCDAAWNLTQFVGPQNSIACVVHAGEPARTIRAFHIGGSIG